MKCLIKMMNFNNIVMFEQCIQVDIQLETGEYFLSDRTKSAKKWQEKQEKQAEKTAESKRKREAAFIAPEVLNFSSFIHIFGFFISIYFFLLRTSYHYWCMFQEPIKQDSNLKDDREDVAAMATSLKVIR